jgi:hypothetical protein
MNMEKGWANDTRGSAADGYVLVTASNTKGQATPLSLFLRSRGPKNENKPSFPIYQELWKANSCFELKIIKSERARHMLNEKVRWGLSWNGIIHVNQGEQPISPCQL